MHDGHNGLLQNGIPFCFDNETVTVVLVNY